LENNNLTIKLGYVRWATVRLNPIFYSLGNRFHRAWNIWYLLGALFGVTAMFGSVILLGLNLFWTLSAPTADNQILTPVIPGVNVPNSQLVYYFLAIMISGVIHEFGHALAAVSTNKNVTSFGMFLMFIYPGAFVDIPVEDFHFSNPQPTRRDLLASLKVFTAGGWHNAVLALLAFFCIAGQGVILAPFFAHATGGVIVTSVRADSAMARDFRAGDQIVAINGCPVTHGTEEWDECWVALAEQGFKPLKYCVAESTLGSDLHADCCVEDTLSSEQCWERFKDDKSQQFCHSVKTIIADNEYCKTNSDCHSDEACVAPVLPKDYMILHIKFSNGKQYYYAANPADFYLSVKVSNFQKRFDWLFFVPINLPELWSKFFNYLMSISGALGLMNLAPVYYLDGEYVLRCFVQLLFPAWTEHRRQGVATLFFRMMTTLFVLNIIVSLGVLYLRH
jgi:S2P endopeptidase